jgi:hypothetical protein
MKYIPPSKCDRCVPTVTLTRDCIMAPIAETAHQPTCPNHPTKTQETTA